MLDRFETEIRLCHGSELNEAQKVYPHPNTQTCDCYGKSVFADIKDLQMTSSWNIQVGPKSNDKYPYTSQREKGQKTINQLDHEGRD